MKLIALQMMALVGFNAFAAPGPRGIAINKVTKQCMNYWPGDEHHRYELPTDWVGYFYDPNDLPLRIKTPSGECRIAVSKKPPFYQFSACCRQLGFHFINDEKATSIQKKQKLK